MMYTALYKCPTPLLGLGGITVFRNLKDMIFNTVKNTDAPPSIELTDAVLRGCIAGPPKVSLLVTTHTQD